MDIEGLMTKTDPVLKEKLRSLVTLKSGMPEKYLHPEDTILSSWIRETFDLLERSKDNLGVCDAGMEQLTAFFLKMVNTHADI